MPTKTTAFLLLFLAAAGAVRSAAEEQKKASPFEEAVSAYEQGQAGKALDICLDGLEANPSDRTLYLYALEILPEERSKYGALLNAVDARSGAGPDDYARFIGLCKIYRTTGRAADALPNCKKARELEPTVWQVYRELGLTYSKSGNRKKALEFLSQGVEISSANYKAHYYLAAEYERSGDRARALKHYRRALELAKNAEGFDSRSYSGTIEERIKRLSGKKAPAPKLPEAGKKAGAAQPAVQPAKKAAAAPPPTLEACVREADGARKKDDFAGAEKQLSGCAAMAPQDAAVRYDHADMLLRLGKYEQAVAEYQLAADLFVKKSPGKTPGPKALGMAAACHIKTARTWAKLGDKPKTGLYYQKALDIDKNNLDALFGLAEADEAVPDPAAAAALYERILKIEPSNAKAKQRLTEIRFTLLSNTELLAELKERRVVDPSETELSEDDIAKAKNMRAAEKRGAIEYLKGRTMVMSGFTVSRQADGGVKLLLTGAGFNAYHSYITRDAIKLFETKGVTLRDMFSLKDLKGKPIFDPGGKLTSTGITAYWQAEDGAKSWLLSYEAPPPPPDAPAPAKEKDPAEVTRAEKDGYREISEQEYSWLLVATKCPENILTEKPGEILKIMQSAAQKRYFICYVQGALCSMRGTAKLGLYIEGYRHGDTTIAKVGRTTDFFGSGGTDRKTFCRNGKIWLGD